MHSSALGDLFPAHDVSHMCRFQLLSESDEQTLQGSWAANTGRSGFFLHSTSTKEPHDCWKSHYVDFLLGRCVSNHGFHV
jgi:hypothetical protein